MKTSWKSRLKKILLGQGERLRKIPFGLYKNLFLLIDPACETLLWLGLYERETYPWLRKEGRKARTGIDVGAGHGELTLWLLRHRSMKQVYAFEPDAQRWAKFEANLAANPLDPDISLELSHEFFMGSKAKETVQKAQEPILLKIDIDGGEYDLLRELQEELRNKDVHILLEVHSMELNEKCRVLLEGIDYKVSEIPMAWWRKFIPEQRPLGFNQWLVAAKK
jgi:hypothetical protein